MITYSIIKKSKLEGASRLDAEYYQPEYFIDFARGDWRPISEFLELCQYGISQAMNEKDIGYPIFRMNDIKHAFLVDEEIKHVDIPENVFAEFRLDKGDVLFNRVNAEEFVGRTGIFKLDGNFVFASYLIRLKIKDGADILPGYLNVFLNSSFGIKQIRKFSRRAVNQANVNAEELKQIKIAVLPRSIQQEIARLSDESWRNFESSKSLYSQAEELFLEELRLKDFQIKDDLSFVVNLAGVKSANRLDSDFFQPKYDEIFKKLGANQLDSLATNFEIIKSKNFEYNEEGEVGVVKTKQLGRQFVNFEVEDRAQQETVQKEKLPILANSDVVFASMGVGSLGKTNIYYDFESDGEYTIDSTLRVFRKKNNGKILPEVLAVYLSSWVGQELIYKYIVGTSGIISIYENYLQNFLAPVLPKPTQQKIADLIRQSHEARKKAGSFLEEAKTKVEEMIEKGGV